MRGLKPSFSSGSGSIFKRQKRTNPHEGIETCLAARVRLGWWSMPVRKERIPMRGLKRYPNHPENCRFFSQKRTNPHEGIETLWAVLSRSAASAGRWSEKNESP